MVRFGIVGCGNIAHKFADAVKLVDDATITCCASHSQEKAKAFARETGIPAAYGSHALLFASDAVDVVYVATTCNFHYQDVKDALEAGKSVLCEKAMVTSSREAEELFSLARKKGLFLFEGMWSLFLPTLQKAREWIQSGKVGNISLAYYLGGVNAPKGNRIFKRELGGGSFLDLTVYPYEILSFVLGKIGTLKKAEITREDGIDTIDSLIVDYEGIKAMIATTAHARIPSPSGIFGDKGYILLTQTHRTDTVQLFDQNFELVESFHSRIVNGFEYEIEEACRLFRKHKTHSDIATPEMTISFMKLMEEAL